MDLIIGVEEVGVMEVGADPPMVTEITGFKFEDILNKKFFYIFRRVTSQ